MNFVTTRDGTQLYVKDWGEGRPVIMVHGWPLTSDSFDDLSLAIADAGMRAISYDRRGFGRSSQPWDGYDYATFANDLEDVITHTKAERVTLLGFSMGGGEVARYLTMYSSLKVSQAILISSVVPFLLKTDDNPEGVIQKVFDSMAEDIKVDRAAFWTDFFKAFYGVGWMSQPVSDEVLTWSANMSMQASLKATLASIKAFSNTDFRPDLNAFKLPTLVIHGTDDKTVPIEVSARMVQKGIPHAKCIEYEGAPHGLLVTHKERVIADVLHFLHQ